MDDDFGADDDFIAALAAAPVPARAPPPTQPSSSRPSQPTPQRIQQPTPQRLDKAPPSAASGSKIVQPTPQALPSRSAGSSILVSPRQKGNPVLANIKSMPWEYSDIPADYGLGLTTCALFLSLKYHRLHPEYIYTRIRNLQGKFALRILLTMVDIPNHEDSLRELAKTSLVNNVTVILCWSAAEAARYLELYKSYEHQTKGGFSAIRGQQATGYAERLVEFVTVPRAINKADAVALVGTFGSLREAVNADAERVGQVGGWGEKKVKAWSRAVEEPFRIKKAAARRGKDKGTGAEATPISRVPLREMAGRSESQSVGEGQAVGLAAAAKSSHRRQNEEEDEDAMIAAAIEASKKTAAADGMADAPPVERPRNEELGEGIAAALAKLRQGG
ncbi:DNA repair protein rad10 [Coniochaeta sp. 2T2.1]|nr:DNA repair protein rad10 [Coniochaeta sp. 2T2.1]